MFCYITRHVLDKDVVYGLNVLSKSFMRHKVATAGKTAYLAFNLLIADSVIPKALALIQNVLALEILA